MCCSHSTALQSGRASNKLAIMFNMISLILGFAALGGAILGFFPFLGWINWVVVPLALIGAGFGMASKHDGGRRLNIFVIVVGIVRLIIGGGLL